MRQACFSTLLFAPTLPRSPLGGYGMITLRLDHLRHPLSNAIYVIGTLR